MRIFLLFNCNNVIITLQEGLYPADNTSCWIGHKIKGEWQNAG